MNERLKEVRKALNLSQEEFGKKLGVSRGVIVNMELSRAEIKPLFIEHLCSVFSVNKEWLFSGLGEMFIINDKNTTEAVQLFRQLTVEFQEYALSQIRGLLEIQNKKADPAVTIPHRNSDAEIADELIALSDAEQPVKSEHHM